MKITGKYVNDMMDTKYCVIAKCEDGEIMIGKDGNYYFDLQEAAEIAEAHSNMGAEITVKGTEVRFPSIDEIRNV